MLETIGYDAVGGDEQMIGIRDPSQKRRPQGCFATDFAALGILDGIPATSRRMLAIEDLVTS